MLVPECDRAMMFFHPFALVDLRKFHLRRFPPLFEFKLLLARSTGGFSGCLQHLRSFFMGPRSLRLHTRSSCGCRDL